MAEDPLQQAAIDALTRRIKRGLPELYNQRRMDLSTNAIAQLVESGLLDNATRQAVVAPDDNDPETVENVTYKLVVGPNGKVYRQAFAGARDSFNARGLLGSSFMRRQQNEDKGALDLRVAQALRELDQRQAGLGQEQGNELYGLETEKNAAQQRYAAWRAAQPVALPEPPAAAGPPGMTPTPGAPQQSLIKPWGNMAEAFPRPRTVAPKPKKPAPYRPGVRVGL